MNNFIQAIFAKLKQKRNIETKDIVIFIRQFATLIAADVPILKSFDILEKSQTQIQLRLLIYHIKKDILSGKNLFSAMQEQTKYFDNFICQLIHIGEQSGKLHMVLAMIATQLEKNLVFKQSIKRALFYPSVICLFSLLITFMMFITVIPRFAELFASTLIKLPLITQWIFYLSCLLQNYFFYIIFFVFALIILFFSPYAANSRLWLQRSFLSLPFINHLAKKILLTGFTRQLSICLAAGIPLLQSLKLIENSSKVSDFKNIIATLRYKISSGIQFNHAMTFTNYFPELMMQMTKIGEESGKLEYMLDKVADFIEAEITQILSHSQQLLEPLIMILLGVLIGGLVIGIYLPIFKLGNIL